ncbi:hypothetical protein [Paracoccus shanxieyensis]|uniref:Uncharacterized protein n=1 Tax=Paracoccus shanxieyensis TaxID=2675752 RepID=A0A6L6J694_9RHOB|nr:hypothetical protein [Paracoccus shanxieyensis]MTH66214.1 hypothetical protein [Paracoccus shanxieyensis]MTH89438.1 hypothetical protein [Paracoccus shanxieyensis]
MPDVDLIAYCPAEKADKLPPQLREYLAATNTRLELMPTEGVFSPHYKQGNKLIACAQPRPHAFTIFLDTDTVLWQKFDLAEMVAHGAVCAAPEGRYTWGKPEGHWERAYSVFGMAVPEERIKLARTGAVSPPYFNAGVVTFPNAPVKGFTNFADCWLQTALELDKPEHPVPTRRPWLDQIALPIAIARAGLNFKTLDDRFNLSLTHNAIVEGMWEKKRLRFQGEIDRIDAVDARILHYHVVPAFRGLRYEGYADDLVQEFTVFDSVADMNFTRFLDYVPKDMMKEFHQLNAVPKKERTPEQAARWKIVHGQKHEFQKLRESADKFTDVWPDSILPRQKRASAAG